MIKCKTANKMSDFCRHHLLYFLVANWIVFPSCQNNLSIKNHTVNSQESFEAALNFSNSGDTIIWKDGTYSNIDLYIDRDSLTIRAETPGNVILRGASRAQLIGNHNLLAGFQFLGGNIGTNHVIEVCGSHNFLSEINIEDYFCRKYFIIHEESQHTTITYSNFENRAFIGDQNILSVMVSSDHPGYHVIRFCSFKNFEGIGKDMGTEPIRIGLSTQNEFVSRTTVEYCFFTNCDGDGEIISHKSRQNVYRNNLFYRNAKAELVLRHGDQGVVYGNFFIENMGGVRVKEGQRHLIFNNYFSNNTDRDLILVNHSQDPVDSVLIAFNTFVENAHCNLGAEGDFAPKNIFFVNNILVNLTSEIFTNKTGYEKFENNLSLGVAGKRGFMKSNDSEILSRNNLGYSTITAGSPAIDAASDSLYHFLLPRFVWPGLNIDWDVAFDIMDQKRPNNISARDLGCFEFSPSIVMQPMADASNTGPRYLR